jgi:predicted N-acetyltransferase YhbS
MNPGTIAYIRAPFGSEEYWRARDLRERVLRKPLGLALREIDVRSDAEEEHFCAVTEGRVIACVLFKPLDERTMKLRQMAVDPEFQKTGIGSHLVRFAEDSARVNGVEKIVMDARADVTPFYEKLGYAAEGGVFESVGIPHQKMMKSLR